MRITKALRATSSWRPEALRFNKVFQLLDPLFGAAKSLLYPGQQTVNLWRQESQVAWPVVLLVVVFVVNVFGWLERPAKTPGHDQAVFEDAVSICHNLERVGWCNHHKNVAVLINVSSALPVGRAGAAAIYSPAVSTAAVELFCADAVKKVGAAVEGDSLAAVAAGVDGQFAPVVVDAVFDGINVDFAASKRPG